MKALKIRIKGLTASFRYPLFISGYQPTLTVPPLSTVLGLISAAAGEVIRRVDFGFGYNFSYQARAVDLETAYEIGEKLSFKTNVWRREFLYEPELTLYLTDLNLQSIFKKPVYQLLLGRSQDLAWVAGIDEIELAKVDKTTLKGCLVPAGVQGAVGPLVSLPVIFDGGYPRKRLKTAKFIIIDRECQVRDEKNLYLDPAEGCGVFLYEPEYFC
ncbi:type I-B CRISPR-associated protein Cas5b [Carboxydothermus ferrireducens]|uniref:CRISPR-associated protein Cas5t n=1 Tax=Carboxydothermus ferrireducens DSM 11255 TaxID=1119529 RepID=A0ABX2RCH2_9THEO|nr:type I-B CRISPR-associated protein Cas5b [Carboxydothermus ferrireducens]NYE57763.1 CRISPR-associated protein Cas5t [Carboxydothermus ferrireducens DSM 11255]